MSVDRLAQLLELANQDRAGIWELHDSAAPNAPVLNQSAELAILIEEVRRLVQERDEARARVKQLVVERDQARAQLVGLSPPREPGSDRLLPTTRAQASDLTRSALERSTLAHLVVLRANLAEDPTLEAVLLEVAGLIRTFGVLPKT